MKKESIVINGRVLTFRTTVVRDDEILIGPDTAGTIANFEALVKLIEDSLKKDKK